MTSRNGIIERKSVISMEIFWQGLKSTVILTWKVTQVAIITINTLCSNFTIDLSYKWFTLLAQFLLKFNLSNWLKA